MSLGKENKKARLRKDYAFFLEYRTRWIDNDMYAHMNNTIYVQLFDSIVNHYLINHCGIDPFSISHQETGQRVTSVPTSSERVEQVGVIVSSFCDYFQSVRFPDVLELGLRVLKLGVSSVTYEVGVFKKNEDSVKVVGGYTHVFCDRDTMRTAKGGIDPQIRRGLDSLCLRNERENSKL